MPLVARSLSHAAAIALSFSVASTAVAQSERIDTAMVARIRAEGLQRSQVMETLGWLTDVYGPRLTGSPTFEQAGTWTMDRMKSWGLSNVHQERWPFGTGWSLVHFSAQMTEPQVMPLIGVPRAWTPGTNGAVVAEVVRTNIESEADFATYRGRLRGKIVLSQPARAVRMLDGRIVLRYGDKEIQEAMTSSPARAAGGRGAAGGGGRGNAQRFAQALTAFYKSEGVVAVFDRGSDADSSAGGSDLSWYTQRTDGGTVFASGGGRDSSTRNGVPGVTLAVEHYNRMVRLLDKNIPVKVALDLRTQFYDETTTPRGFNIVAEIPGTDARLRDEVVMIGAHFDSWHGATGATDNGAGSAAMLEAMRILQSVGARPRRTIRIGLWGGEEQGLLGSRAYASAHFGDAATMALKPEHARLSAYYNIDNGTGKIRGIWTEGNTAAAPIFTQLTAPLRDLGVEIISPRTVGSTDHVAFDALGLPAFQFVQERYEYNSRTHHSNMDFLDRVQPEDMKQMATVVATLAYLTAQRDELLPRKPRVTP